MRVPLSWLRELVALPGGETGKQVAERLTRAGLKVEGVEVLGASLSGPVLVGRVLDFEEVTGFRKPIRWCSVDVGEPDPRGIVCGATNFGVGDPVVVALPGSTLPGGFAIGARRTYGRTSDGMICSARELGLGEDSSGILVLPGDPPPGTAATALLGLPDEVLDVAVTPDRGYALSMRGIARETATAYGVAYADPAAVDVPVGEGPGHPVRVEDPRGCDVFVAMTVTGVDPTVPPPAELAQRLVKAGLRSISLAVDVTNYVMLELGQPLHAYDQARLQGALTVRRAAPGERLRTLDGTERGLEAGPQGDLLITDDSGPVGIAGVMGGASSEISEATREVVLEAAHFDPATVARAARRHRLPSEASRRFERGVDPALQLAAARRAAELLVRHGGGRIEPGVSVVGAPQPPRPLDVPVDLPARVAGYPYAPARIVDLLQEVGCVVDSYDGRLEVVPPSWRTDLTDPYDLVEEVVRLHGYDAVPSVLPQAPPGRGLTPTQRRRRRVDRALAAAGYVEAPGQPFVGPRDWDALGLPAEDPRRNALRLVNPLSEEEPQLRTTLLPGLLATLRRNLARGLADVALFETGLVFLPGAHAAPAPRLPVTSRPGPAELAALDAALPRQPRHVAVVLAGEREPRGWWGPGRPVSWADALEAAREAGRAAGVSLAVRRGERMPWHPGRCGEVLLDDAVLGHAGELHPRVVQALGLPGGTAAMELALDPLLQAPGGPVPAPRISPYPAATQDVALVVDAAVPAAEVEAALREGAGELLESLRLFDLYTGRQVPAGTRSLAFALRFRAPDRTLTVEEASAAREAAVAAATRRTGAVLRGA